MPVRREIPYNEGLYFITFTCYKWLPMIEITNSYEIVYRWVDYLKTKNHHVVGYVIMPNHIHVMISFSKTEKSINKIIGDGKRFMAYDIIKRLEQRELKPMLEKLEKAVSGTDKKRGCEFNYHQRNERYPFGKT
jgi:REP element-mobilizing transposase RayT